MKSRVVILVVVAVLLGGAIAAGFWHKQTVALPRSGIGLETTKIYQVVYDSAPYTVDIRLDTKEITAGQPHAIFFDVKRGGKASVLEAEGRLLHVIVSSHDWNDIVHTLRPTFVSPGVYRLDHTFTRPGDYRVWAEIDNTMAPVRHHEHAELLVFSQFTVAGGSAGPDTLTRGGTASVEGYTVHLVPTAVTAGEESDLRFYVTTAEGRRVDFFNASEPAFYVIVGNDFSFFRHGHAHAHPDDQNPQVLNGSIDDVLPSSGEYVVWFEAHISTEDGDIRSLPVSFVVTAS